MLQSRLYCVVPVLFRSLSLSRFACSLRTMQQQGEAATATLRRGADLEEGLGDCRSIPIVTKNEAESFDRATSNNGATACPTTLSD